MVRKQPSFPEPIHWLVFMIFFGFPILATECDSDPVEVTDE